ncbi:MAG: hypothetical protein MUF40_02835 [Gemmatimonadaceae bacterium]|jgi:hypothetical protein|nr:hypothetical protein [Gemmatimonadaceae bacterium]
MSIPDNLSSTPHGVAGPLAIPLQLDALLDAVECELRRVAVRIRILRDGIAELRLRPATDRAFTDPDTGETDTLEDLEHSVTMYERDREALVDVLAWARAGGATRWRVLDDESRRPLEPTRLYVRLTVPAMTIEEMDAHVDGGLAF